MAMHLFLTLDGVKSYYGHIPELYGEIGIHYEEFIFEHYGDFDFLEMASWNPVEEWEKNFPFEIGKINYFSVNDCKKLSQWLESRLTKPFRECDGTQNIYPKILEYSNKAIELNTALKIDLREDVESLDGKMPMILFLSLDDLTNEDKINPNKFENSNVRYEEYDFNRYSDIKLLDKDFIDSVNKYCDSLLDISDVDYFSGEKCKKLVEWLKNRFEKPIENSRLVEIYTVMLDYAERAVKLNTGVKIEL